MAKHWTDTPIGMAITYVGVVIACVVVLGAVYAISEKIGACAGALAERLL